MTSVESSLRRVAQALEPRVDELVDDMLERMLNEIPEFLEFQRPELAAVTRRSCYANVRTGIDALLTDGQLPPKTPAEAETEARQAARLGMGLPPLLQTYRVGHAAIWDHVLAEIEALDLLPAMRRSSMQRASRFLFSYVDSVIPDVTDAYTRERDQLVRAGDHRRARLVRDLLDGADTDTGELGYDTRTAHVGAVAWGEHPEEALRRLADELTRARLLVSYAEEGAWMWIAASRMEPADWQRIAAFDPGSRTQIAVGSVAGGIEGFRRTHREAKRAYLVARRGRVKVTRFHDVTVETLALADEQAARDFVTLELGPLAANSERCHRLRETLLTYLTASSNASAAASALGVNDRTIAYRLQSVNELLGYPFTTRALELHVALRLNAALNPTLGRTAGRAYRRANRAP